MYIYIYIHLFLESFGSRYKAFEEDMYSSLELFLDLITLMQQDYQCLHHRFIVIDHKLHLLHGPKYLARQNFLIALHETRQLPKLPCRLDPSHLHVQTVRKVSKVAYQQVVTTWPGMSEILENYISRRGQRKFKVEGVLI